jgi:hypothetical protein
MGGRSIESFATVVRKEAQTRASWKYSADDLYQESMLALLHEAKKNPSKFNHVTDAWVWLFVKSRINTLYSKVWYGLSRKVPRAQKDREYTAMVNSAKESSVDQVERKLVYEKTVNHLRTVLKPRTRTTLETILSFEAPKVSRRTIYNHLAEIYEALHKYQAKVVNV